MKKSNIPRISTQLLHLQGDSNLAAHFNKSLPTLADFLGPTSLTSHIKGMQEFQGASAFADHKLDLRPYSRTPNKRFAHLQDAYGGNTQGSHKNHTVEEPSKDGSIKSSHNTSQDTKKSNHLKSLETVSSVKGSSPTQSRDFSKLVISKLIEKRRRKPEENNKGNRTQQSHTEMGSTSKEAHDSLLNEDSRKSSKLILKDIKKIDNIRNEHSEHQNKLRRIKMIYNNSLLEDKVRLNVSQPQTTKHNLFHSMVNTTGSPLFKDKSLKLQELGKVGRVSASPGHPNDRNNVRVTANSRLKQRSLEKAKESHKKTHSSSPMQIDLDGLKESVVSVEKSSIAYDGKHSLISPTGLEFVRKSQLSADKEMFLHPSREHLLSEPIRYVNDSLKRPQDTYGSEEGRSFEPEGNFNLESFAQLESAFFAFLDDHTKRFDEEQCQIESQRIIKAWIVFKGILGIQYTHTTTTTFETEVKGVTDEIVQKKEPMKIRIKQKEAIPSKESPKKKQLSPSPETKKKILNQKRQTNSMPIKQKENDKVTTKVEPKQIVEQQVQQQQNVANNLKKNEQKTMKLISFENVQDREHSEHGNDFILNYDFPDMIKFEKKDSHHTISQINEENASSLAGDESSMIGSIVISSPECQVIKETQNYSNTKSITTSTLFPSERLLSHTRMGVDIKSKLKLNFASLTSDNQADNQRTEPTATHLDLNGIKHDVNKETQGFHEEFMAKFDEFSPSWRQAAKNRNFCDQSTPN